MTIFMLTAHLSSMSAQGKISRDDYIQRYKDVAMDEMKLYGIPASITLAQSLLESDNGNSMLATKANNHFGIKCHSEWNGKTIYKDDDAKGECFRVYKSAWESFRDHSKFLQSKRYQFLYDLQPTDYKAWAKGLKKAGYATNPKYPDLLIKIIEDNELYHYDSDKAMARAKERGKERGEQKVESEHVPTKQEKEKKKFEKQNFENANVIVLQEKESDNGVKYILSPHDVIAKDLAVQLQVTIWTVMRYNDVENHHLFKQGDRIYLEPKRGKGVESKHVVKEGETLWSISQQRAIRVKKLVKLNGVDRDDKLEPGTKVKLR